MLYTLYNFLYSGGSPEFFFPVHLNIHYETSLIIQSFYFVSLWSMCDTNPHLFHPLWSPDSNHGENNVSEDKCTQVEASQIASAANAGTQMMGGSVHEEIGKFWPNLPPTATRPEHFLANVSLVFATQLLLHEAARQAFNHGGVDLSYFPWDDVLTNQSEWELNIWEAFWGKPEWSLTTDQEICRFNIEGKEKLILLFHCCPRVKNQFCVRVLKLDLRICTLGWWQFLGIPKLGWGQFLEDPYARLRPVLRIFLSSLA